MLDGTTSMDIDLQHGSMADEGTSLRSDSDSESDSDSDESEIDDGPRLEPRRPHSDENLFQDVATEDTTDEDSMHADRDPTLYGARGLAESQLEQQPFIVPYPGQRVGDPADARIRAQDQPQSAHANASYKVDIAQDKMNPYTPFASQLDWDIAKWAKLRGPGSTAFDELMAIPGVCALPSLVKSLVKWLSNAYRYKRSFRYHSKALESSMRSSTTSYPGGHPLNVMRS